MGYLYTKLPEKRIRERMDYFKELANELIKIRKSGSLRVRKTRGVKEARRQKL